MAGSVDGRDAELWQKEEEWEVGLQRDECAECLQTATVSGGTEGCDLKSSQERCDSARRLVTGPNVVSCLSPQASARGGVSRMYRESRQLQNSSQSRFQQPEKRATETELAGGKAHLRRNKVLI